MSIPNPRLSNAKVWMPIDKAINSLIDRIILEFNPKIIDDLIPDFLDDWDNRETAIEYLIDKLKKQLKGE